MKSMLIFTCFILFFFWGCQQQSTVLTDAQKETIEKEVRTQYDTFNQALNTMNLEILRQLYSNSGFLGSLFDGMEITTYEALIDSVYSWWSNRLEQKADNYDVKINVLSEDLAIVTSTIEGYIISKNGEKWETKRHAFSLLFKKEPSGWKIIYYHESDGS